MPDLPRLIVRELGRDPQDHQSGEPRYSGRVGEIVGYGVDGVRVEFGPRDVWTIPGILLELLNPGATR